MDGQTDGIAVASTVLAMRALRHAVKMGGWWRWARISLDGVAPSQMVGVFASVNLPWHHKVQMFILWHQLTRVVPGKGL